MHVDPFNDCKNAFLLIYFHLTKLLVPDLQEEVIKAKHDSNDDGAIGTSSRESWREMIRVDQDKGTARQQMRQKGSTLRDLRQPV